MIVQRFNLNLIPNQSPVVVHVNQYDTGTGRLIATLYEGNEPYSPNGTAVIQGTKPDGHGFQYTATLDGNVVTADLTEQMAPVAGDVRVQIVVTESSGVTGTFVFIMRVQPSALPSDADMSESDYPLIEEAIREAQEAVERAQEAITETQENAEDSEAWAQGTRGGIPVGPTDPTYEHNAEYWAQYAERYAQGGLHYKASIPFADIPTTGMREGDMYDITDDFTTDSRFEEGAGIEVKGGTNIAWNSDNKWDILALPYIPKTTFNGRSGSILPMAGDYDSEKILLSSALHIGGETQSDVQEALEALENNKADKVDNAVADNFAGLDANGNLKDSGKNAGDFATPSDIEQIYADNGVLGAKNLLRLNAGQGEGTFNGFTVTYNYNSDGTIKNVVFNGTSTQSASGNFYQFAQRANSNPIKLLPNTAYIFSIGNTDENVCLQVGYTKNNGYFMVKGSPFGADSLMFVAPSDCEGAGWTIQLIKKSGSLVLNNWTVYPMLRLASDPDDTHQPYAMTNRELTEKIKTIVSEAVTEAFSAHGTKWHDNANDCNVGFERTNDYRTSNMPTTGTASASLWYDIMTVRESNVSTSSSFSYGFQIAVQTTATSTMGDTYVRAVSDGATPTWSEWKKLN